MSVFAAQAEALRAIQPMRVVGKISSLRGLTLLVEDLPLPVGALVSIESQGEPRAGEVVGFEGDKAIVMLLGMTSGVRPGDAVSSDNRGVVVRAGPALLGRVIDGLGRPLDGRPDPTDWVAAPLHPKPLSPLKRRPIAEAISTGVRAIDAMNTVGRGQRMGIFAGPGVGKSTLLGTIARNTDAEVNVIALIGERGREVREFIERALGEEGLARSVVVVATSDESPLLRIRAAFVATAIAESFRDRGADVMLMMDSVTRFAQAQRQVGLAVGEPPATKGYTPSVFAMLPLLLERAGAVEGAGSITGFYAILVEGDDMTEPISDAARGILDGHLILSRDLAQRGHYPAVDALDSVSRAAPEICDRQHLMARAQIQKLLAALRDVEELVQIGAYAHGSNPEADVAMRLREKMDALLRQEPDERDDLASGRRKLVNLAVEAGALLQKARKE